MIKSNIAFVEEQIKVTKTIDTPWDTLIDLRNSGKKALEIVELLPSLMYNHIIILPIDIRIMMRLNEWMISFVEIYKRDSEAYHESRTRGYIMNPVYCLGDSNEFDISSNRYEFITKRNSEWVAGYNYGVDRERKRVAFW